MTRVVNKNFWPLWCVFFFITLDQIIKSLVTYCFLGDIFKTIPLCYGLDLVYTRNRGVSFGMLSNFSHINYLLIPVIMLIIGYLIRLMLKSQEKLNRFALVFIVSGGGSNLIDRFLYGGVVDFLYVYWGKMSFFTCNVADILINFGGFLWFLCCFKK